MRKVIDGLEYNTDMSLRVCMSSVPLACALYQHEAGGMFLTLSGETDVVIPVTAMQAENIMNSGVFDIVDGG